MAWQRRTSVTREGQRQEPDSQGKTIEHIFLKAGQLEMVPGKGVGVQRDAMGYRGLKCPSTRPGEHWHTGLCWG